MQKTTKNKNPKNYWFKRRRYGYGWTPVTWQGWTTLVVFVIVLIGSGVVILGDAPQDEFTSETAIYMLVVAASVVMLIVTSLIKGPVPKWRMGKRADDDPDEDF